MLFRSNRDAQLHGGAVRLAAECDASDVRLLNNSVALNGFRHTAMTGALLSLETRRIDSLSWADVSLLGNSIQGWVKDLSVNGAQLALFTAHSNASLVLPLTLTRVTCRDFALQMIAADELQVNGGCLLVDSRGATRLTLRSSAFERGAMAVVSLLQTSVLGAAVLLRRTFGHSTTLLEDTRFASIHCSALGDANGGG